MLRKEQKKLIDQLADPATKASDVEKRTKLYDILMGQQIGKLREILQDTADEASQKSKAAPAK